MLKQLNKELENFIEEGAPLGLTKSQAISENTLNGKTLKFDNQSVLDFTRLDYMALGNERVIKDLMIKNIQELDISCPASQIILKPGIIEDLESTLANWHGLSKSLVFTNGYSANINMMQALGLRLRTPHLSSYVRSSNLGNATRDIPTVFLIDSDAHYSLFHGIKIARKLCPDNCYSYTYKTHDYAGLDASLEKVHKRFGDNCIKVIVSDTLISGLGHVIEVDKLYALAEKHDTLLYLDEAHAVGIYGKDRAGVARDLLPSNFDPKRLLIMGTLTKVLSQLGGYVAIGDEELHTLLRVASPQYVFSAPLLPWMAKTINETIDLLKGPWGETEAKKVLDKANYLRSQLKKNGFDCMNSTTQIVPIFIGEIERCYEVRENLISKGFNVAAFVFPSMPKNQSILRVSVCRDITIEEMDEFVIALTETCKGYKTLSSKGIVPSEKA